MFVAASNDCYKDQPFEYAVEKIAHLEFASMEISIREGGHITPQLVRDDLPAALEKCQSTHRLNICGYFLDLPPEEPEYLEYFEAVCKLAKATKVVTITVAAGEHGTPFNEEVERYKDMVKIAERHGVRVGMRSEVGHLSDDPDTVSVICGHVKGLGLSLDPSHYLYGRENVANYDHLLPYVQNVHLRDSTKNDLQVRVGQGVIEYGKLINQLRRTRFNRALCVDIEPRQDIDHDGELRKLRLLLESLLVC